MKLEHGARYVVRRIIAGMIIGALAIVGLNLLYVVLSVILWAL